MRRRIVITTHLASSSWNSSPATRRGQIRPADPTVPSKRRYCAVSLAEGLKGAA